MTPRQLVYLHGFASSPRSSKARFFEERAEALGVAFACPDLNGPDFEGITITRMVEQVDALIDTRPRQPVVLVGSSLGALVALFTAARRASRPKRRPAIDALVLLAPALDLARGLETHFGPLQMAEWERSGRLQVFHYGDGLHRDLGWDFMADARRYDAYAVTLTLPTVIYQGRRDTTVDPATVIRWAEPRPHAVLHLLDDDHQLLASLETMWQGTAALLLAPVL